MEDAKLKNGADSDGESYDVSVHETMGSNASLDSSHKKEASNGSGNDGNSKEFKEFQRSKSHNSADTTKLQAVDVAAAASGNPTAPVIKSKSTASNEGAASGSGGGFMKFIKKHKTVALSGFAAGQDMHLPVSSTTSDVSEHLEAERRKSQPATPVREFAPSVLKKAASINLEQKASPEAKMQQQQQKQQSTKVTLVHKTDFKDLERFEGKIFVNWIASKLSDDNYLKIMLTEQGGDSSNLNIVLRSVLTHVSKSCL
jgi:hypothetical protein